MSSSPAVLEGGNKKHHKKHKTHESKRGRSGLTKAEEERLAKGSRSDLMKDAEKAFDFASEAKVAAAKGQWENAEMEERNAADSEAYVERDAKKKYVKKAAASAELKEVSAAKKIRTAMKGGSTEVLAGGEVEAPLAGGEASAAPLAGGDVAPATLAGGEAGAAPLAGGDAAPAVLAGGDLEGGADLEGGKKGSPSKKAKASKAVGAAKTAAKKAEYAVIREVAGVHVGHTKKTRERREASRSRSPKHHSKSPKKHHSKSPKKHRSKSPKRERKEGSPRRELPSAFKMWSEARNEFFEGKKQKGILEKGSREYEAVRRIYEKMRR
jgi:hypothetical protein